jgi:hypothetical protein
MRTRKWVQYAVLSFAAVIFLSTGFAVVSILYGRSWSDTTAPPLLGNRPEVVAGLTDGQSEPEPFSFLVVGDTRSSTIFEEFYQETALAIVPDFGIIIGDFVANPELNRHRFFMGELAEWGMRFPVFVLAGNHDIVTKHERRLSRMYDPVYVADFEKMYGPTNFSFTYRGCLFIGLNDAYRIDYLGYLEEVLAARRSDILMTFVFIHIPPPSIIEDSVQGRQMEGEAEFMRMMDEYNVDFVFAGDFHSYFRTDRGHTRYIVTGGGGSNLSGDPVRSFHHALLMKVDPANDRADETIYALKPTFDPGDDVETVMICLIYPVFERRPVVWVALFSVLTAVSAGLIVYSIRRIRRNTRGSSGMPIKVAGE